MRNMVEMMSPCSRAMELPVTMGSRRFETLSAARVLNRQAAMLGYMNAFMMYTVACLVVMPLVLLVRQAR